MRLTMGGGERPQGAIPLKYGVDGLPGSAQGPIL